MKNPLLKLATLLLLSTLNSPLSTSLAQGFSFTYQGHLTDGGSPATGLFDFQFALFDASAGGSAQSGTNTLAPVGVTNGLFTVTLDFGSAAFDGAARWLEMGVRTNGSLAPHAVLAPRQPLTPAPYAIHAGNAALLNGLGTNAFAPASGSSAYVAKAGDTMTGTLNLPANGLVAGANQLVLSGGNVGVGTTIPDKRLVIARNIAGDMSDLALDGDDGTSDGGSGVLLRYNGGVKWSIFQRNQSPNHALAFSTVENSYANSVMTLLANGNVGIGTTTPGKTLDVKGDLRVDNLNSIGWWNSANAGGSGLQWYAARIAKSDASFAGDMEFYVRWGGDNTETKAMSISSPASGVGQVTVNGNVGIGTANPRASLDVLGWMRVNSSGPPFPDRLGLELGVHNGSLPAYSWIQSHESRPLALNPLGSDVGIGTATPHGALHVLHPSRPDAIVFSKATADAPRMMLGQGPGGNGDEVHFLSSSKTGSGSFLPMTLWTGDRERMRIDANGSVGIGTTSPNLGGDRRELTVSAGTSGEGIARLNVQGTRLTDNIYGALDFYHQANNPASIASYRSGADDAGNLTFWTKTTGTALAERMRIDNNGNVGIGTTEPSMPLEVRGQLGVFRPNAGSVKLSLDYSLDGVARLSLNTANDPLRITKGGTDVLAFDNANNVGIGTISPVTRLHVDGGSGDAIVRLENSAAGRAAAVQFKDTVSGTIQHVIGQETSVAGGLLTGDTPHALVVAAGGANPIEFGVNDQVVMAMVNGGNVGIGTRSPTAKLEVNGSFMVSGAGNSVTTPVLTITGGSDVAEPFQMAGADIPKGAVVVIDDEQPGRLKLSERAYDTRVAGIISGAGGVQPGITLSQQGVLEGGQNVALSGRVYVQADATESPIKPGDLLTTAATPGHAMKVRDHSKSQGAILGKAMSALKDGKGLVLVLVTLQ